MKTKNCAQVIGDQLWAHYNGRTFSVPQSASGRRKKSKAHSSTPDQVHSPMPGKVTKVFIKVGDVVKKGQALLVIEAMKMEYTLKSDMDGCVQSLQCQLGDQVILGKLLVQLGEGS